MSREVILHIGHHRTGTSTLQELVFPQLSRVAFFYKDSTPESAPIVRAFGRSPAIWRQQGEEFFRRLASSMKESGKKGGALISAESMSAHNYFVAPGAREADRRDPFLLAEHLNESRAAARRAGFDDLKVIVGIRRQDEYLASFYGKAGFLADNPSQADFERQSLELIDPERRYFTDGVWLDYKLTRDLLVDALGEQGVLILPLELLAGDPTNYFAKLSIFIGEQLNPGTVPRSNSRRFAEDSWRIGEKPLKRNARKKNFGLLRALATRPVEIKVTPSLKQAILGAFGDSNKALASALDVNLEQYGYCARG